MQINDDTKFRASRESGFSRFSKILYGFMFFIAMSIYVLQKFEIPLPRLINNYLNDLLCMPLVLGALTFLIRRLKKDPFFRFPLFFVLFMAAFYAVYFEYYLPKINLRYTADWIDVALYFTGSIGFYVFSRKANGEPQAFAERLR